MTKTRRGGVIGRKEIEGPWVLPKGWHWEQLGEAGRWYGGGTPSKGNSGYWANGTIPWLSPKDMKTPVITDTEDHITEDAVADSATKLVPACSVACVMRSGILRHTFPVAVTARKLTLNQDMRAVRPRHGIDARYLAHFLRRSSDTILQECSKDGTTVNSIETSRLMALPVPLPTFQIQCAIRKTVEHLFCELDEGKRLLGLVPGQQLPQVETLKKSILIAAFKGELRVAANSQPPARAFK